MAAKHYGSYSEATKPGKLFYDPLIFTASSMPYMYTLLNYTHSTNVLNGWIKEQTNLFPSNCSQFDYRLLVRDGKFSDREFSKYFH